MLLQKTLSRSPGQRGTFSRTEQSAGIRTIRSGFTTLVARNTTTLPPEIHPMRAPFKASTDAGKEDAETPPNPIKEDPWFP